MKGFRVVINAQRNLYRAVPSLLAAILVGMLAGCSSNQSAAQQKQNYSFWPQPPDEPRVQYLTSFQRSSDVTGKRGGFDEMIYGKEAELPITSPYSLAMWKGKIYVCDTRSAGVTILDLKQKVTRIIGRSSAANVTKAADIAITPDGIKYVADTGRGAIVVFDAQDRYVITFAPANLNPVGIAVYGNELFVTDLKAQQVKVLDRGTGKVLRTIGSPGIEDGHFVRPLSIRIDKEGNLVVSDVMNARIQIFSRDGKHIGVTGERGRSYGELYRPKHLAIDSNNFLYVVDASFNNVQLFDEQRKFLMYFGSAGDHPGAMDLPAGVFVDEDPEDIALFQKYVHSAFQPERLVLVTNQNGPDRVAVYAQGHLLPGKTLMDVANVRASVGTGMETKAPATQPGILPIVPEDAGQKSPSATQPAAPTTLPAGVK